MLKSRAIRTPKLVIPKRKAVSQITTLVKHNSTPIVKVSPIIDPELGENQIMYSSHKNFYKRDITINLSPPFTEIPPKDWRNFFKQKCNECCKICDFTNPNKDVTAKLNKSTLLKHIIHSFSIPHIAKCLSPDLIQLFYKMVSVNIFREFPPVNIINLHDGNIPTVQDAAWAHLSIIYEALSGMLTVNGGADFPPNFLQYLVGNITSYDNRERVHVTQILTTISNKFPVYRTVLKKKTIDLLTVGKFSPSLIEWTTNLLGSLLIPPLKSEFLILFQKTILPLHCIPEFFQYSKQVCQLVGLYIAADPNLLNTTLNFLLLHWPISDSFKQIAILDEMDSLIVHFGNPQMHKKILLVFFKHVGNCITGFNSSLADRCIQIIQKEAYAPLIKDHTNGIIFILISALYDTSMEHWDSDICSKAKSALHLMESYDPQSYKKAIDAHKLLKSRKRAQFGLCKTNWQKVFEQAKSQDPNIPNLQLNQLVNE